MKHYPVLLFLFLSASVATAQMQMKSAITIDSTLRDTFTFDDRWDYPWDIDGHIRWWGYHTTDGEKHWGKPPKLYHTANAVTSHQGEHEVRYAELYRQHDTTLLVFMSEPPGYMSGTSVFITGDSFYCQFHAVYPAYVPGEKLSWENTMQQLVLYPSATHYLGYLNLEFVEKSEIPGKETHSRSFYYRGFFKIPLSKAHIVKGQLNTRSIIWQPSAD